ncbi:MAG: hypothetical protein ACREQM_11775 [Candidatus Dormibacteraceae bacterium]
MTRKLLVVPLVVLMILFGVGVYFAWGASAHQTGQIGGKRENPTVTQFVLPGTVLVTQDGNIYELQKGTFTRLTHLSVPAGSGEGWTQPTVTPDHQHIIAVKREYNHSDLYELSMDGTVQAQLTDNASSVVPSNHWSFFPRLTSDGGTLYYTYDPKLYPGCTDCYDIDFALYSMPLGANQGNSTVWTNPYGDTGSNPGPDPDPATGGSLQAEPLPGGGVIFSYSYENTDTQQTVDQISYLAGPMQSPVNLTPSNESCYSPAVSKDGTRIAFICSPASGGATTSLEIATLSGGTMGTPQVVESGSLLASPTWSPDGQSLLYLDATGDHQLFELQTLAVPVPKATPTPAVTPTPKNHKTPKATPVPTPTAVPTPQALTENNDFDATSAPVWF